MCLRVIYKIVMPIALDWLLALILSCANIFLANTRYIQRGLWVNTKVTRASLYKINCHKYFLRRVRSALTKTAKLISILQEDER